MKVYVNDSFYHFLVNGNKEMFRILGRDILETSLQKEDGTDLGKKVTLIMNRNPSIEEDEVMCRPRNSTFKKLKSIHAIISYRTCQKIFNEIPVTFRDGPFTYRFEIKNTKGFV